MFFYFFGSHRERKERKKGGKEKKNSALSPSEYNNNHSNAIVFGRMSIGISADFLLSFEDPEVDVAILGNGTDGCADSASVWRW